jgi:hypothetical protein
MMMPMLPGKHNQQGLSVMMILRGLSGSRPCLTGTCRWLSGEMDHATQSRVPYVLILLKARSLWLEQNGGVLPTFATKANFIALIKSLAIEADNVSLQDFVYVMMRPLPWE